MTHYTHEYITGCLIASGRQHAEGTVKTWEDLDRYRQVITRTRPELIVECGSFSGRSAVWFAQTAACPVVTVDVDHSNISDDTRADGALADVTFLRGRSTSSPVIRAITARAHGRRTMVVLDSDHSAETVLGELLAYAPLVTPGCYLVVEDTLVRWMPTQLSTGGGPYRGSPLDAVEQWLPHHPGFAVDTDIEALHPTTQFPSGWIRRS